MIKTLSRSDFIDEMTFSKGSSYENCFSYEAKIALFNYYEEFEESTGEVIECDPIAFCCEWREYENLKEVLEDYTNIRDMEDLLDHTQVIEIPNSDGRLLVAEF